MSRPRGPAAASGFEVESPSRRVFAVRTYRRAGGSFRAFFSLLTSPSGSNGKGNRYIDCWKEKNAGELRNAGRMDMRVLIFFEANSLSV